MDSRLRGNDKGVGRDDSPTHEATEGRQEGVLDYSDCQNRPPKIAAMKQKAPKSALERVLKNNKLQLL